MRAHECYHCKQWIEEDEPHDCWTTTEAALTRDLTEDLRDAWERLRETAADFGEQRIYASHKSIMFSRKVCYFFVRPKRKYLEVCVFLGRRVSAPQVKKVDPAPRAKLCEAYDLQDTIAAQARKANTKPPAPKQARKAVKKRAVKKRAVKNTAAKKTAKKAPNKTAKKTAKKTAVVKKATRR
jgi:hypothetical protein